MIDLEDIPEELLLKKMRKYLSVMSRAEQEKNRQVYMKEDPEKYVWSKLSDERAVELMEKLKQLHPDVYSALLPELYRVLKQGMLKELDGLTIYAIIRRLGLDIRPELRIRFVKDGKEVDFKEYTED